MVARVIYVNAIGMNELAVAERGVFGHLRDLSRWGASILASLRIVIRIRSANAVVSA